ncbi:hypothetical protein STA1M1_23910 [Sinisalibacter aestuarii]|uniref:Probable membrane transporter protein n=1 Tax=Sinisalibacter aestuarii TaxID=2949426 RepID=A0ABQ5LWP9_9RHOB|nr:hypothetical protein STA1M1_23910 [Sinisalibacter aestuarii]
MEIGLIAAILGWGLLVGIVFSAIGAAGGILTSFGLITLFGMLEPNSVKPMTQIVVLATALTFVPGYLRRGAIVPSLGVLLGVGGVAGAWTGSTVSARYLSDMATFRPLFGLLTLAIAAQIGWKLWRHWQGTRAGTAIPMHPFIGGVTGKVLQLGCMCFDYAGKRYRVPILSPLLAGAAISFTAALFGVGGGFLLVPYMATIIAMPMHIIPATTAIPIFMSLLVSVGNFVNQGAVIDWPVLSPLVLGAVAGALLGGQINKRLPNAALQATMMIVVAGIGLKYVFSEKDGRGSRVRTRDLRFWRPSLYQLSYTPKAEARGNSCQTPFQDLNRATSASSARSSPEASTGTRRWISSSGRSHQASRSSRAITASEKRRRSTCPGLPTTTLQAGTSLATTAPAPITAPLPMVTPGITLTSCPSQTSWPIRVSGLSANMEV